MNIILMKDDKHVFVANAKGRGGTFIPIEKYTRYSDFIISVLTKEREITFFELLKKADVAFNGQLSGECAYYFIKVKSSLEVHGIIQCDFVPRPKRTQILKLKKKKITNNQY